MPSHSQSNRLQQLSEELRLYTAMGDHLVESLPCMDLYLH